jgi:hypothetical protein
MDNSKWRRWQKESWPAGSLERTLIRDYPGSKSLSDALKRTILNNSPSSKEPEKNRTINEAEVKIKEPTEIEKYRALQESIKNIEHYSHLGFDTWQVPEHTRARLNAMPLNSIEEIILWRDHWKAEIRKIKEQQSGDSKSGKD